MRGCQHRRGRARQPTRPDRNNVGVVHNRDDTPRRFSPQIVHQVGQGLQYPPLVAERQQPGAWGDQIPKRTPVAGYEDINRETYLQETARQIERDTLSTAKLERGHTNCDSLVHDADLTTPFAILPLHQGGAARPVPPLAMDATVGNSGANAFFPT